MARTFLKAFLLCVAISTPLAAQIELASSKSKSIVGLASPRIVADRILVGADSKPSISEVAIITAKSPSKFLRLKARKSLFEVGELTKISDTEWVLAGEGKWIIEASAFDPDRGIDEAMIEVVIGQSPKPEPDPPKPDPIDPPGPKPDALPIAGEGFRVLMVYESADLANYPEAQKQVMYAKSVRDYLSSHAAKGPDGRTPDWRIFDQDADLANDAKTWQDALKRKRTSLPWVVISNGKQGWEGPMPASVDDAMKLFKKYGGE